MSTLLGVGDQPTATIIAAVLTVLVSVAINVYQYSQMRKAEDLKFLLGGKESVAYAALELLSRWSSKGSLVLFWLYERAAIERATIDVRYHSYGKCNGGF